MSTNRRARLRAAIALIAASFLTAQCLFWLLSGVFEPWNAQVTDQLFRWRSRVDALRPKYDDRIVQVDLNNTTIQQLNNFYLTRAHFAKVVDNLAAMGVAAQVYDFIFAARSNDTDDRALIEATSQAGNVYFGLAFALTQSSAPPAKADENPEVAAYLIKTSWSIRVEGAGECLLHGQQPLLTFPALAEAARGLGFISIASDRDGVFRRVPLLVQCGSAVYPSIAFRASCDYLGVTPEDIVLHPGVSVVLRHAHAPGQAPHDITIPIDSAGNMIVNFIGPWERMKHYSFSDVYRAAEDKEELALWREELQGKIVVVSDVSTGSTDIGPVPTDTNFPLSGLHANVIHTILSGSFVREITGGRMLAVELALALALLFLALSISSIGFVLGALALGVLYAAAASLLFFQAQVIVHLLRPLFFIGFATTSVTAYRYFHEARDKAMLHRSFEAYFPPAVVKKIIAHPELIAAKGEKKELTILFSDIEGFTMYSSGLAPDEIQRSLNEYFEAMVEIVFRFGGTVDKYIGDGLMVFFGDPEPQVDHALRCVRAAIAMQHRVRELKGRWAKEGNLPIRIRIGVNTGEVVVGNMGSARRLSYTVLGSAVNLAQRLESSAPVGGILISQSTYEAVKDEVPTRSLGEIQVKGISDLVAVHEILID